MIPPTRLDDGVARRARRADAEPGRAARRPARPARRAAARPAARRRALRAPRPRAGRGGDGRALRLLGARRPRRRSRALPDGRYEAADVLEAADGELEIRVAVTIAGDELEIDFAGTAPQHDGQPQLPARRDPLGVLLRRPLPDRPRRPPRAAPSRRSTVRAPEGCLVNARPPAAVAAGNVETSSRIVDVALRARSARRSTCRRRARGR